MPRRYVGISLRHDTIDNPVVDTKLEYTYVRLDLLYKVMTFLEAFKSKNFIKLVNHFIEDIFNIVITHNHLGDTQKNDRICVFGRLFYLNAYYILLYFSVF